jgi:hypothetical protein
MTEFRYFQRIMFRFSTLFGQQKVAAVFEIAPEAREEMAASWESFLQNTKPEVIQAALRSLAENPPQWPPALAEFIQLCREYNRPEQRAALPPPKHQATELGKQMHAEIQTTIRRPDYDFLDWAKYPGSAKAVDLLMRGAKEDRRLREILDHLIKTDGADCRRDDARQAIRKLSSLLRSEMAAA